MNSERLKLYSGPLSMFGAKVQIAALEKALEFELVMVPYTSAQGYSPKHVEVLRVNPKAQVPVLTHGKLGIFDSTQIFEYLEDLQPNPPLWPRDIAARALARQLEHQSDEVYFPHIIRLMSVKDRVSDPVATASVAAATSFYKEMEVILRGGGWLARDYSYADIAFFMAALFGDRHGVPITPATPGLFSWRERMIQRPAVRTVVRAMAEWLESAGRPVPAFMSEL